MRNIDFEFDLSNRKLTEVIDFETAHELFKAMFCVLLKASEYERSINSLQFDQSLAIRVARIVGNPELGFLAGNTYPMFLVGHCICHSGLCFMALFTEHLHEHLVRLQKAQQNVRSNRLETYA